MKFINPIILCLVLFSVGCNYGNEPTTEHSISENKIPAIRYNITKTLPHDTNSFTEGLFIQDGKFYESTGGALEFEQAKSLFGILDTSTGKINVKVNLDKNRFFGEGITLLNDKIYQLTYRSRIGFIYDAKTYKQLDQFSIPSVEGWGFTTNGLELIMSDGTNKLFFINPNNMQLNKQVRVTENGFAVDGLNELEYVNGSIYANIFTTNMIVKIDAQSGNVIGKMDMSNLFLDAKNRYPGAKDMNGIAYDSLSNKLFVTGKFWPTLYEIELHKL